jgi:hypothetical protein
MSEVLMKQTFSSIVYLNVFLGMDNNLVLLSNAQDELSDSNSLLQSLRVHSVGQSVRHKD